MPKNKYCDLDVDSFTGLIKLPVDDLKKIFVICHNEKITKDDLVFSVEWIEKNEKAKTEQNPFNNILFR